MQSQACSTTQNCLTKIKLSFCRRVTWSGFYRRCDLWCHTKTITWFARIPPGKTFVFWQPARKCTQSYYDCATQCPAKHDVYSVLSTEGGLNVNIGHVVYCHRLLGLKQGSPPLYSPYGCRLGYLFMLSLANRAEITTLRNFTKQMWLSVLSWPGLEPTDQKHQSLNPVLKTARL